MAQYENPIVFISYSQDSVAFADKVLEFSNRLRSEGIDAILDQYEEAPPEGWPRWMENSIDKAKYVIVIGSKGYYDKICGNVDRGKGLGVKWEGNLIYQKLYKSDSINEKYIPVVFDEKDLKYIPAPLLRSTYYNVSDDVGFDKLYWRLRGVTTKEKPPLGKLRPLPEKKRKILYATSMIDFYAWDNARWRGAGFLLRRLSLPILLLIFTNEKYAIEIFKDWIDMLGRYDKYEDIRIVLVEGNVPGETAGYYVVVSSNLDEAVKRAEASGLSKDELILLTPSRFTRANPTDNFKVFNRFKEDYHKCGEYILMPAVLKEGADKPKILDEYGIHKKQLIYRHISDITEKDQDGFLLKKDKAKINDCL